MIIQAEKKQGLVVRPGLNKTIDLIKITGEGVFVSMFLSKQGGSNDLTSFNLMLDGKTISNLTFVGARNLGLNKPNNSGITLSDGALIDCIAIQFNEPIQFKRELKVQIRTSSDLGVVQILGNVVTGKNCLYP